MTDSNTDTTNNLKFTDSEKTVLTAILEEVTDLIHKRIPRVCDDGMKCTIAYEQLLINITGNFLLNAVSREDFDEAFKEYKDRLDDWCDNAKQVLKEKESH